MTQLDMFEDSYWEKFLRWKSTPEGGRVMNRFIRLAIGCKRRGEKVGHKAIIERLRWHYRVSKAYGEAYKINNNYAASIARYAMSKVPELKDYFAVREVKA